LFALGFSEVAVQFVPPHPPGQSVRPGRYVLLLLMVLFGGGCYAPIRSVGIPASALPDTFRLPLRTGGPPLNFASLTMPAQTDYLLGPGDIVEVTVHGLVPGVPATVVRTQVMGNGEILLPMVGAIQVGGRNLMQAQQAITAAYADGVVRDPRVNIFLAEKSATSVLVLGEVRNPGVYRLPKYENDVAHALASAGGLSVNAGMEIEIHRRTAHPAAPMLRLPPVDDQPPAPAEPLPPAGDPLLTDPFQFPDPNMHILRIPLRGFPEEPFAPSDTVLQHGDVLVVPSRRNEVFFVVGKLSANNAVRFSLGLEERELGAGFILPRDREIDVVTAVCMAGYIDPIDSPTTVTVHRCEPDGTPMLIRVNLIKARYDHRETVLVQPGDIIYLNPDVCWWTRRTFDRIIPSFFALTYRKWLNLGGTGSDQ
jgi:polysaccharide export outer membrane protein